MDTTARTARFRPVLAPQVLTELSQRADLGGNFACQVVFEQNQLPEVLPIANARRDTARQSILVEKKCFEVGVVANAFGNRAFQLIFGEIQAPKRRIGRVG